MFFALKVLISAVVIASVSELAKRYSVAAAILAAIPLTSILALSWLYVETGDTARVSSLSTGIFWAVLPTLLFFIVLPALLRLGIPFAWAMISSCVVMASGYGLYVVLLRQLGIKI